MQLSINYFFINLKTKFGSNTSHEMLIKYRQGIEEYQLQFYISSK